MKRAIQAKKDWERMKKQARLTEILQKRLDFYSRQNDRLILKILNSLKSPKNQNPAFVKLVKKKLSFLTGGFM